jgi:hypothetical protein
MAEPVNATSQSPVLPPEAWYTSAVQFNAVIAAGAQLVSIGLRVANRYFDVGFNDEDVQLLVADIMQGAAIVFGVIAIVKRQTSSIQPLTLTAAGAEKRADSAQLNPANLEKTK